MKFRVLDKDIAAKALDKWGIVHRLDLLQEEFAEAITAVNHWKRRRQGSRERLAEELADALICIDQILDGLEIRGEVERAIVIKTDRLRSRLWMEDL